MIVVDTNIIAYFYLTGEHWFGVITHRGKKIRIISVRRSRKEEVDIYEGA